MSSLATSDHRAGTLLARSWRVTTATRAFVLALAAGNSVATGGLDSLGITILAVGLVFATAGTAELAPAYGSTSWWPVIEGILVSVLVGSSAGAVEPLLVCLLVPPVVAGIRHGWVPSLNTSLAAGVAMAAVWTATQNQGQGSAQATVAAPWLVVGLGAGLLAGWLTRSIRALEESRAPYAAAHRLVAQLHTLSQQLPMGLDSHSIAEDLLERARRNTGAERAAIFVLAHPRGLVSIASYGDGEAKDEDIAQACLRRAKPTHVADTSALPLRIGDHVFGVVVLVGAESRRDREMQDLLDDMAVRLDTALLFDDVRSGATAEERNRLARDIHDGIAQEVAALGFLVDDLVADSMDEGTRSAADALRLEISRVVSELRFSIFDLRHGVDESSGLTEALRDYIREVGSHTGLEVHLRIDESGEALPKRTESEVLRIAQEAVANVRKHAAAANLWVSLSTQGRHVRLRVEDDGAGGRPTERPGHYGLHVMHERARRINADLTITSRPGGGTRLTVESRKTSAIPEGDLHVHPRLAGR